MRKPEFLMIHHSLTKDSQTVSWGAIERYHRQVNGWQDIGYHFGLEMVDGTYYALLGRPITHRAAACPQDGMNERALHICCVGNFDLEAPSPRMLDCLAARILNPLMDEFGISPDRIIGHRDRNPHKSCPGTQFDLDRVRRLVR